MKTINFVGNRRKELHKAQVKDVFVFKWVLGVFIALFVFFLITLAARLYFVFEAKKLSDSYDLTKQNILAQQSVEKDFVIFAQKLKKLSTFFEKRKDKQEVLLFFNSVFGPEVIVSAIDYSSAESDIVLLTIKTPSIFAMERAWDTLDSSGVSGKYKDITKSNLRRSATGNYTVDLAIVLSDTPS